MANDFSGKFREKIATSTLDTFETKRVVSKTINTQFLEKMPFGSRSGTTVAVPRPTDAVAQETPGGDISGSSRQDIVVGDATVTVQNMITTSCDWNIVDQALKMGNVDETIEPFIQRLVTKLETNVTAYMVKNCNLSVGDPDTAVTTWAEVAEAGALAESIGFPEGEICYAMNPYTQIALSGVQNSLNAGETLVDTAFKQATINPNFAGMRAMTSTALGTYGNDDLADRVGTLSATPDATYATAKDTMTQTLAVTGLTTAGTVKAGSIIEVTDNSRNRLNLSTREQVVGKSGGALKWRAVVTADVTLSGGAGNLVCAGPAIYETGDSAAFNTVSSALTSGDAIEILGTASTTYQPNMFYHKNAFCIGSVPLPKLYSTDCFITTKDGLQIRVSKGTSFLENKQIVRFDLHPAFGTFNPFLAGQGFGNP